MTTSMQTTLCKGLRACGLPKAQCLEILNTILKWDKNNGAEWVVERMKGYKQWYETCLAGHPEPPPYYRHDSHGYPTNVWGKLFRVRNQAKALAVLSASTIYVESSPISPKQREKFLEGLNGHPETVSKVTEEMKRVVRNFSNFRRNSEGNPKYFHFKDLNPVTPEDMTGTTIPLSDGRRLRLPTDYRVEAQARALLESWRSIPQAVLDYLDRTDHLDWIPENLSDIIQVPRKRVTENPVGAIGVIQEPNLKARTIANPNRVAQAFTKPLAEFWEKCMKQYPSDCTFDQDSGMRWVQEKLKAGMVLSSSDLSSATDLLDLSACLELARAWCLPYLKIEQEDQLIRYCEAEWYFVQLSRGTWQTPKATNLGTVRWKQGQPLGLYPSFRLLALTNNALGMIAASMAHLDPQDSYRTIGDDIIMDARMEPYYVALVESIGGKVNRTKTLTSDRVAEFAGRIITPQRVMLKTIKFKQPSDESFMQIVSDLGPQSVGLLANRQRRIWEEFKFIPGVAYDGPWSKDSFGEPLVDRVRFAESTSLFEPPQAPDPVTYSEEQEYIRLVLEAASREGTTPREIEKDIPWPVDEDIQSSRLSGLPKPSGDPRRKQGLTTLQRLEREKAKPTFIPYRRLKAREKADTTSTDADADAFGQTLDRNPQGLTNQDPRAPSGEPVISDRRNLADGEVPSGTTGTTHPEKGG